MPKLILDGDARGAVKATTDLTKAATAYGSEVKKNAAVNRQGAAEQRQAQKEEQRRLERATTAWRQHNQLISRVLDSEKQKWNEVIAAGERHRYGLGQVTRATESVNTAQSKMAGFLLRWAGPAALFTGLTQGLGKYKSELDAIIYQDVADRGSVGKLMQLAVTAKDPIAKREELIGEYKGYYGSGATRTKGEAAELVFQLESAGINTPAQRKLIADLLASGVMPDAKAFAGAIAAVRSTYPELAPDKILGMGIVAGIPSPGEASELVSGAAASAEVLKSVGASPALAMAATSILSRAYGGVAPAKDYLAQFAKQLEHTGLRTHPELRGKNLLDVLEIIKAGGLEGEQLEPWVGTRMEAQKALRTMANNLPEFRQLTAMAEGGDAKLVQDTLQLARTTPDIEISRQNIAAQNRRALSREYSAQLQSLLEAKRDTEATGRGALDSSIADLIYWIGSFLPDRLKAAAIGADPARPETWQESTSDMDRAAGDVLNAIKHAVESIDRKTSSVPVPAGRQE